jgi:hypothetical protein
MIEPLSPPETKRSHPMVSPAYLSSLIIQPLRFLFYHYGGEDLQWKSDNKETKIEIDTINNFHKVELQQKPRVLISRGGYGVTPTGLTDNMAEDKGPLAMKGLSTETRLVFYQGMLQVLIQARQEGTCEKVLDLTQHFLLWTAPYLCNTQGFKSFGPGFQISPCTPNKEDTMIFETSIGINWIKEEMWTTSDDALKLKGFSYSLSQV